MQIIVGQVARKENFWGREAEIEDIWYKINSGSHILLVAPRRVGKTSIMHSLLDKPRSGYKVLYVSTEAADRESEFWEKLFHKLIEEESFLATLKIKAKHLYDKFTHQKIDTLSMSGVKFADAKEIDYARVFREIIKDLKEEQKLIIMIDEFAQTIENIIKFESEQKAEHLLKMHRELRQDDLVSSKVSFIYAGSIGLESVASKMNATKHINDLASIKVAPFSQEDAVAFTLALTQANEMQIARPDIEYLLHRIEWLIPFYIQILVDELHKCKEPICQEAIDNAFYSMLDNNRNHFEHWHTRLKSFSASEYKLAKETLNILSQTTTAPSTTIINLGYKYKLDEEATKEIMRSLVYDGYINNNDNAKEYRFNSPILKLWWCNNVAN